MPYVYSLRTFHSASHLKPNYGGIYISSYTLIPTIQFYSTRHHQIVAKSVGENVLFLDYPQFCQWFLYFSGLQCRHLIFDFSVLYSLPLSISYFFSPQCLLNSALLLQFISIFTTSFIYLNQMTFSLSVSFQDYKAALYFSWGELQILQPAIQGVCFCSFLLILSLQSGVSLSSPLGVHHRFIIIAFILSNNSQCMVAKNVYTTFTYTPSLYLLLHLLCSFHL